MFTGLVLQLEGENAGNSARMFKNGFSGGLGIIKENWIKFQGRHVTKTCLYNFDPHKPHFYIVKLGFTGVNIICLISAQKH